MEDKQTKDDQSTESQILLGIQVEVTFANPAMPPETVTIRKVSLRNIGRYASVLSHNEAAEIGMYTGKSEEWAEALSDESVNQVMETGRDLSKKRYTDYATRAAKFGNQVMAGSPALEKIANSAVNIAIQSRLGG